MRHKLGFVVLLTLVGSLNSVRSQDFYYTGGGQKILLQRSLRWVATQVTNQDVGKLQQDVSNSGLQIKQELDHTGRIFWLQARDDQPLDSALARLQEKVNIIRTFPAFFRINENGDTSRYILFDQFIVKFRENVGSTTIDSLNAYYGVEILRSNKWGESLLRLKETSPHGTLALANLYYEEGFAEWAQPNFLADIHLQSIDDPLFPKQWWLQNTGQTGGPVGIDINVVPAWDITRGSSSIVVAVLDEGVETHEDFYVDQVLPGYQAIGDGDGGPGTCGNKHGEAVAGIIAANHNTTGVRGVAPNIKILPINIWPADPSTEDCRSRIPSINQLAIAIDWAWENGADILSNSWRWTNCGEQFEPITSAINRALTNGRGGKGCLVVFAAGNDPTVPFPACLPGVLTVGAVTHRNEPAGYTPHDPRVDVVALSSPHPGGAWVGPVASPYDTGIVTTDRLDALGYSSDNYASFAGTSAAAPQVSGIGALILSLNPNLEARAVGSNPNPQVQNIIKQTANDCGSTNWDGFGRVNAYEALKKVITPIPSSPAGCGIVSTSPVISWASLSNASSYRLQAATSNDFANPVRDITGIATTSYQVTGLANSSTYYWRVSAFTFNSIVYWSTTWSFSTSPPSTPQLTGSKVKITVGGIVKEYPKLTWTYSGCDVTYELYKYFCDTQDCLLDQSDTILVYAGSALSDTDQMTPLGSNSWVSYYVVAVANTDQNSSSPSNTVQFQSNYIFKQAEGLGNGNAARPKEICLAPNYPNPFNPRTRVSYGLSEATRVKLVVYDVLGREIRRLVDAFQTAGYKSVDFDAGELPAGVYFYRLHAGKYIATQKMLLAK